MDLLKALRVFIPEAVRLVDKHVVEFLRSVLQDMVQFTDGLHLEFGYRKFRERLIPILLQHRWADDEFPSRQLSCQEGSNVGLTKADYISQEDTVVCFKDLLGGHDSVPLIFQI